MRRRLAQVSILTLAGGLVAAVTPAPAAQAADAPPLRRTAVLDVVQSDAADAPQRRLARVEVTQDLRAQRVSAVATYAAVPTLETSSAVYVWLGNRVDGDCRNGILVAGGAGDDGSAGSFFGPDGAATTPIGVTRTQAGATVTLVSDASPAIAQTAWDCAYAASMRASEPITPYTVLRTTSLTEELAPVMQLDAGEPLQGADRGKWVTVEVDVRNDGDGPATGVRLRGSGKGLKIKQPAAIGAMEGRRTTSREIRVKLKSAKQRQLTVRVQADGGYSASQKITIAHRAKPQRLGSLSGRYYWGFEVGSLDEGWNNMAVWFVNGRFAHVGFPKKAGLPSCSRVTQQCKRYSFNPRTGKVRIGSQRGKATTEGMKLGKQWYSPLTLPRQGSRLNVSLQHQNYTGYCGISCVTWTERLVLDKRGRFLRTQMSVGSIGAPGLGTVGSAFPPDQRGTYQVLSRGRIRFSYADGSTRVRTIGIEHDLRGKPNPRSAGLLVDDVNFYW